MSKSIWDSYSNQEIIRTIKELYNKLQRPLKQSDFGHKNDMISVKMLRKRFNNKTFIEILKMIDIPNRDNNFYSQDECDFIINNYKKMEDKKLAEHLNRSVYAITTKRKKLNCFKYEDRRQSHIKIKWTAQEDKILKDCYKKGISLKEIVYVFNNKYKLGYIQHKANELHLTHGRWWTDLEKDILRKNGSKMPLKDVCKLLPNRTDGQVQAMAEKLGVTFHEDNWWTKEQDNFIKENYLSMSDYEIAKTLNNRTWRTVQWRRLLLGLEKPIKNNFGNGCIDESGNIFSSEREMEVYNFIKNDDSNIFKFIRNIGYNHDKKGKYVFATNHSEYKNFYPDFVIEKIYINGKTKELNHPIIIEYYGMYNEQKSHNEVIRKYVNKTQIKEKFYKSKDDIYYIGIFPDDIKNNFEGLTKKLVLFFMHNFNIDIDNSGNKYNIAI